MKTTAAAYSEGAGIYRMVPADAVRAGSADEARAALERAVSGGQSVTVRGAGSGMGGGNVGPGLVLDLSALTSLRIDPEARTATAGAGVTCRALNEAAARHGLRFAPEPSSARFATVGGMAACNAAGARSFRYGPIRDWITGLRMITADGQDLALSRSGQETEAAALGRFRAIEPRLVEAADLIRERFPGTRKNAAGYALDRWLESRSPVDLVIGSEGTLGLITEVTLRLEPLPEATGGLRAAVADDGTLIRALEILRGSSASAIEFLDHTFLRLVAGAVPTPDREDARGAHALLLVEYQGTRDELATLLDRAAGELSPVTHPVRIVAEADQLQGLWEIRHAASPILARLTDGRRSLQVIEDGCVPPDEFAEYLTGLRRITRDEAVDAVLFGHAGDAHAHVNLLPDVTDPDWEDSVRRIFHRVTTLQLSLGGTTAGEHGVGRLRSGTLEAQYGREIVDLMGMVKDAFDPRGLLNPGVIFPAPGWDPISHLKVGAGAAPIPEPVAVALREIEVAGGYGRNRMELVSSPHAGLPGPDAADSR